MLVPGVGGINGCACDEGTNANESPHGRSGSWTLSCAWLYAEFAYSVISPMVVRALPSALACSIRYRAVPCGGLGYGEFDIKALTSQQNDNLLEPNAAEKPP